MDWQGSRGLHGRSRRGYARSRAGRGACRRFSGLHCLFLLFMFAVWVERDLLVIGYEDVHFVCMDGED